MKKTRKNVEKCLKISKISRKVGIPQKKLGLWRTQMVQKFKKSKKTKKCQKISKKKNKITGKSHLKSGISKTL
jgi:hypothetical protein